jgi:hypothetical protein
MEVLRFFGLAERARELRHDVPISDEDREDVEAAPEQTACEEMEERLKPVLVRDDVKSAFPGDKLRIVAPDEGGDLLVRVPVSVLHQDAEGHEAVAELAPDEKEDFFGHRIF